MTFFKPLEGVYIVRRDCEEKITSGGIYIPDTAQEKPAHGFVEAKGAKTLDANVGDKVFFNAYSGASIILDDEEFIALRKEDLYAVLIDEDVDEKQEQDEDVS